MLKWKEIKSCVMNEAFELGNQSVFTKIKNSVKNKFGKKSNQSVSVREELMRSLSRKDVFLVKKLTEA